MKTALFIGRFQPFHLGHLSVLKDLKAKGFDRVIIGIGSSQYSNTNNNPLSCDERTKIIETVITNFINEIPFCIIVPIEDIHDDINWVKHVNNSVSESYDMVVSGNSWVTELFSLAGIKTQNVNTTIAITGSEIRDKIRNKKGGWQKYIHPSVCAFIEDRIH